ncbi:hypothetical protein BDV96DRAFT_486964 [Lophiotrema nucula]|uniref:Calcineurin-like phosphoesterase domain-containing protein n=1 Tax=Lophiotrema nucula TaxID=690887 RepID=A0A6A5ZJV9_9PLEO|nr:hypothetical protein BDV96DRAFT_486964 [Lophiotrema nucula]
MQLSTALVRITAILLPVALLATGWLYSYPVLDKNCGFPPPSHGETAPFRLLALGDPQLEGDSSLSKRGWARRLRKRLDLWGNDFYLAHIVRSVRYWTKPTHVAVLGDLLGSQWISNEEFASRSTRYWNRVFKGMQTVEEEVMLGQENLQELGKKNWEGSLINIAGNHDIGYAGDLDDERALRFEEKFGKLNWDVWFSLPNSSSFEGEGEPPALRLIILNSMNLDAPALSETHQSETYDFLNYLITTSRSVQDKSHATVLLTHIPLHKREGTCVDSPFFSYFPSHREYHGVKEQNMLSEDASKTVLEGVFGLSGNPEAEGRGFGRPGIILNGHDHEGCDTMHFIPQYKLEPPAGCKNPPNWIEDYHVKDSSTLSTTKTEFPKVGVWNAMRLPSSPSRPENPVQPMIWENEEGKEVYGPPCIMEDETPTIREITLRSMMGDFGGYAGFLSAWFNETKGERGEWMFEFKTCGVGVQHWWWTVHVVDIVTIYLLVASALVRVIESKRRAAVHTEKKTQ